VKRSFLLGIAAAAAASAPVFFQAPAQAACVTPGSLTNINCTVFDPQTTTTDVETFAYNDGGTIGSDQITNLRFSASNVITSGDWNFSPDPILITNIAYSLDGGVNYITTGINTSVNLSSSSTTASILSGGTITLPSAITANSFRLKFTLPGGLSTSNAGYVASVINFDGSNGNQLQTRQLQSTAFSDTTPTPGPLPLLGAGAAFGFSRRLRSRVRLAA